MSKDTDKNLRVEIQAQHIEALPHNQDTILPSKVTHTLVVDLLVAVLSKRQNDFHNKRPIHEANLLNAPRIQTSAARFWLLTSGNLKILQKQI